VVQKLDLSGAWKAKGFDGQHGFVHQYIGVEADERTFFDVSVPGEIHLDLERMGLIDDCRIGLNALAARWVEENVWLYRTSFEVPEDAVKNHAWLVFEGLDINAVIYLNGEQIGIHRNAFVPCRLDVTGKLRKGKNVLAVSIESGLYYTADKPGGCYRATPDWQLTKRVWLRKPQCQFSWDWAPRLVNVGIWRPVRLEWTDSARIDALTIYPELANDHKSAKIHTRVFVENVRQDPIKALIRMRIPEAEKTLEFEVKLPPGLSRHDICTEIDNPKLWWPKPHGDQPLYNVEIELIVEGSTVDTARRRTGIRSVRINTDPHPEGGEYFILEINGRPIFAKGGNWVPPDIIYTRITPEHYRRLVQMAVDANFNAIRIWGGGLYADHALLDACDEMGILVWHDFIFACAKYPSDEPEFLNNVSHEVRFITRELSHHPSLVVWCGNNELEWGAFDWKYDEYKAFPDYALYHHVIPCIVIEEDPSRPYWPSSPYSTNYRHPNDPTTGDQHPWHVSIGSNGPNWWAYREDVSRFSNEGGVLGASCLKTLREFLPEDQQYLFSPSWEFHDNACSLWQSPPITYQYVEYWLGKKAEEMSFEDYAFYSGILQAEGLVEYANNFRRRMFSSSAAIFWMYNDTWPATHGWTIVDYYLRRKLSYHPVRRAFAPVHVIPVVEGDKVIIFGVNDTPEAWKGQVRYGLFKLAGGMPLDKTSDVTLPPNTSTALAEFPMDEWKAAGTNSAGAFAVLLQEGHLVAQNRIFIERFKDLKFAEPEIRVERRKNKAVFSSPTFVWGVTLDWDGESPIADDVFDILPGISYEVEWPEDKELPKIQRTASPLRS
jgi:beta-mannosidase